MKKKKRIVKTQKRKLMKVVKAPIKKALSVDKQALFDSILKYSERIAYKYYLKHFRIFINDTLSIHDLYQEAKTICFILFKKYHKLHNKNGFNLKKFTSRAVGWRMRDLMRQAITESQVFSHQSQANGHIHPKAQEESIDVDEANAHKYDALSPDLIYGFNIQQIFKKLDEKDLTVLKFMIKYDSKQDYTKFFKNKKLMHVYWVVKLKPKLQRMLLKYKQERD